MVNMAAKSKNEFLFAIGVAEMGKHALTRAKERMRQLNRLW